MMGELISLAISGLISLGFKGIRAGSAAGYNYLRDRRNRQNASEFLDDKFNTIYMKHIIKNWYKECKENDWKSIIQILNGITSGLSTVQSPAQAEYDTLKYYDIKEILAPLIELNKTTILYRLWRFAEECAEKTCDIEEEPEEPAKLSDDSRDARAYRL